ncbi:MAG: YceI family protein [Hyphomicrobium sp.]
MKVSHFAAAVASILLASLSPASAADYVIDTKGAHASINFRIKHLGYSWLTGRFDTFAGTFSFDDAQPANSKVKVEIDTASVNSNHAERDKHLRNADFLDVTKFPKAVFESTSVTPAADGKMSIAGKLTLHGVTRDIVIAAEKIGAGSDPWGGERAGFSGTTTLTLADFGILKELGPAAKAVDLDLHVEGVKQ